VKPPYDGHNPRFYRIKKSYTKTDLAHLASPKAQKGILQAVARADVTPEKKRPNGFGSPGIVQSTCVHPAFRNDGDESCLSSSTTDASVGIQPKSDLGLRTGKSRVQGSLHCRDASPPFISWEPVAQSLSVSHVPAQPEFRHFNPFRGQLSKLSHSVIGSKDWSLAEKEA
jgi:hypothetical protein